MKRISISVALLVSTFACTASVEEVVGAPTPAEVAPSPSEPPAEDEPAPDTAGATADVSDGIVPTGAFADARSFCEAQTKLVAPRIAEANEEASDEVPVSPSCAAAPEILKATSIDPSLTIEAVRVETGRSIDAYLLVKGDAGLTAVRTPFLSDYHDDPGCGSIERPSAITSIGARAGALVVTSTAGRAWWSGEEAGELSLTYARTCRAGAPCGVAEVVGATLSVDDAYRSDGREGTRTFTTTYAVGAGGEIVPALRFDEERL